MQSPHHSCRRSPHASWFLATLCFEPSDPLLPLCRYRRLCMSSLFLGNAWHTVCTLQPDLQEKWEELFAITDIVIWLSEVCACYSHDVLQISYTVILASKGILPVLKKSLSSLSSLKTSQLYAAQGLAISLDTLQGISAGHVELPEHPR